MAYSVIRHVPDYTRLADSGARGKSYELGVTIFATTRPLQVGELVTWNTADGIAWGEVIELSTFDMSDRGHRKVKVQLHQVEFGKSHPGKLTDFELDP